MRSLRPDLEILPIRGNVDTRLAKRERGDADALVLACAGLIRLGRESVITERLTVETCLPQVGQAAVAVQCRTDDAETVPLVARACDDAPTRLAVQSERAFLARVGGGCSAPIAAFARIIEKRLEFSAFVGTDDGARCWRSEQSAPLPESGQDIVAKQIAEAAFAHLVAQGARL